MSLLKNTFEKLRSENRTALISYITGGDPNQDDCFKILESLFNAGTDIIEIGIPFSDPIADGPIIQAASHRSLTNGTNIDLINELIKKGVRGVIRKPIEVDDLEKEINKIIS